MNTYHHCLYKNEPFYKPPYSDWLNNLNNSNERELRNQFESLCLQCQHGVDMPPFLPKSFRSQNATLLRVLYTLGNKAKWYKKFYEWYGKPQFSCSGLEIPVLIKHVNFPNKKLSGLCSVLKPKIIGVVRNPFANISSHFMGEKGSFFKAVQAKLRLSGVKRFPKSRRAKRAKMLRREIIQSGNKAFLKYMDDLEMMPPESLEAVAWRIMVEPMVEFIQDYDKGLLVIYEEMCKNPFGVAKRLFDFSGWEMTRFSKDYLKGTMREKKMHRSERKAYYSIFRNPEKSMNKWKKNLTKQQKKNIALIIKDSPIRGFWPDLPLEFP